MTEQSRPEQISLGPAAGWLERSPAPAEPVWLRQRRGHAAGLARSVGFPGRGDEAWRFTPTDDLTRIPFEAPPAGWRPEAAPAWLAKRLPRWEGEQRVLLVDGHPLEMAVPAGVEVLTLAQAWRAHPELLEPHLGTVAALEADRAHFWRQLNTALFPDGILVRFREGAVVREPVHLVHVWDRHGGPTVLHPRTLVLAEPGSQGTVVQTWLSDGGTCLVNEVTEVVVQAGALLEHVRVQEEGEGAFHLGTLAVTQARDARYLSRVVGAGARLARVELEVALAAPGAECQLDGVYVASGEQHQAYHTVIHHQRPHTTSRERYKGILAGKARAVFDGQIRVHRDAQRTNAYQENRNLLLSGDALVHTKPSLEIDADDVKCGHGATVGQLDHEALFYLRSRGIGELDARGILTTAFAREILDGIGVDPLRRRLAAQLLRRIPECATPGELQ